MVKRWIALVGLLALGGLGALAWLRFAPHTLHLTAPEIQAKLQEKFPLVKKEALYTTRFTDPEVTINPQTNRVSLGISATVEAVGIKAATARAEGTGSLRYESTTGELFLDSPAVEVSKLEVVGLAIRDQATARNLVSKALQEYLSHLPLYKVNDKRAIKSVRIEGGVIIVQLG